MGTFDHNGLALAVCDLQAAAGRVAAAPGLAAFADAAESLEDCWLRWYLLTPEAEPEQQRALDEADRAVSALKAALAKAASIGTLAQRLRAERLQAHAQLAVAEATVQAVEADTARLAAEPLRWAPSFDRYTVGL